MGRALEALRAVAAEPWLALDTEATGLGPYDEVIEVAAVTAGGEVALEALSRPSRPVTAKATRLHGLTAEDLAAAPAWPAVWPALDQVLAGMPVLAWNAAFDLRLLRQTCDRYRLPFRAPRFLCLRAAFRELHPLMRSTLDAACLALGVPERPTHRALQDARVARLVALRLLKPPP